MSLSSSVLLSVLVTVLVLVLYIYIYKIVLLIDDGVDAVDDDDDEVLQASLRAEKDLLEELEEIEETIRTDAALRRGLH